MGSFQQDLSHGRAGESLIATWLRSRGNFVLPVYEKIIDEGKGPQLFTPSGSTLIAPDLLVWRPKGIVRWIEAKRKSAFSWYRNTPNGELDSDSRHWVTGIDLHHYEQYLRVCHESGFPVHLCFLHEPGGEAKDTPPGKVSPSGLFANSLPNLMDRESHRSDRFGKGGMVYWALEDLQKLASMDELIAVVDRFSVACGGKVEA